MSDGRQVAVPSGFVWINDASPRQYSVDELVKKIFGTFLRAASRSNNPSLRSVTGSVCAVSVNGKGIVGQRCRWLAETLVEIAATLAARDVDEHPVKDHALLLVLVEAEIEKLAQIAPALRRTEGIGVIDISGAGIALSRRAVTQKRDDVARRQQPEPDHRGAGCRVDHMVELARDEPRREVDMRRVRHNPPSVDPGERPLITGDHLRRRAFVVAHQQNGIGVAEIAARIGAMRAV